jgi:hypothetical protein
MTAVYCPKSIKPSCQMLPAHRRHSLKIRAHDTKLDRDVALKVLPAGFNEDPHRLGRFQREARTLASLQHPDVASVYGLETAEGQTFLVMKLVEGEDLSERIAREALSVERVVDIASQIATGLEDAHDRVSFSGDGKTIYFATGTEKNYSIGSKKLNTSEPEITLVPPGEMGPHYYAACPVVTNDGNLLFYSSIGENKKQDIAWLDLTGNPDPQPWLTGEAAEYGARPSPANPRYVAFVSEESGAGQV